MRRISAWALALCACGPVVDIGPGTEAETGGSDDSTTTTGTTASATMTTAGPSTTVLDTSASDSVSVSASTTVEPTTDDPPPPVDEGYCLPACEQPVDCCMGEPTCESMLGTYPYDYGCENGGCTYGGCTSDEDCTFGGVLMGFICAGDSEVPYCVASCDSDQDCLDQFLEGWVCNGTYCVLPPCASDVDCAAGYICNPDSGVCIYPCDENTCSGMGHCDPATGGCVCSDDDECMDGYGCAPWP